MPDAVFTIGHSTYTVDHFVELLRKHSITAVCDVRSKPYSRVNPQFNREALKQALARAGIEYVFLGKELGARSEDPSCYRNGQVQYELLAKTDLFKRGITRVKTGAATYRIALMCAEKEPLDCHRTILVARHLEADGVSVQHILGDGMIESQDRALRRLVSTLRLPGPDMFRSETSVIESAYARQADQIAYREPAGASSDQDDTERNDTSGGPR